MVSILIGWQNCATLWFRFNKLSLNCVQDLHIFTLLMYQFLKLNVLFKKPFTPTYVIKVFLLRIVTQWLKHVGDMLMVVFKVLC
jgi:hypothetical protein